MALRKVVVRGDEILSKRCREVSEITDRIRETLDDMVDTMREELGVGLAAPQVGVMRRMFVAEPEPGRVYYMSNPESYVEEGSEEEYEGCLSGPGLIGIVERPQKIKIRALDRDGVEQDYEFEGFDARVMCHENDHLNGVLYTDKAHDIRSAEPQSDEE